VEVCIYIYAYRYEGARFGDIMIVNDVFEHIVFVQITAWERSKNHYGLLEFAVFFPVDIGSTLQMEVRIALNIMQTHALKIFTKFKKFRIFNLSDFSIERHTST
jgi:hypothetical protein